MKKLFLFLSLLLCSPLFAIVTIKPIDVNENKIGFSGEFAFSWDTNRGNTEMDETQAGIYIQYDMNHSVSFLKSSYSYAKTSGQKNIDKSFIHFRNIHKLSLHFDDELFIQKQSDQFQQLSSRVLVGAGLRAHIGDPKKTGRIYLGVGAFYLTEKETNLDEDAYGRANLYLSYKYTPQKGYTLALVSYYQPKVGKESDYLQLSTAELKLAFNKAFSIKLSVSYNVNSLPEPGVRAYDYSQNTALQYEF